MTSKNVNELNEEVIALSENKSKGKFYRGKRYREEQDKIALMLRVIKLENDVACLTRDKSKMEAKLKESEKWTDLQAHLDSYMCDVMYCCFQDAKDDDENAKVTIQNYISMYNCPNEFAVWLDEMMNECFTERHPFEYVEAIGMSMIRRDILDAQGGDGLRKLYDSFKQEMEQSDFLPTA